MRRVLLATVLLPLVACGGSVAASGSGLRGKVVIYPATPVCQQGRPCTAPAKHLRLVFSRSGKSFRTTTDENGRYRIALAPGRYAVNVARRPAIGKGLAPRRATVPPGRYARADFKLDTGIR